MMTDSLFKWRHFLPEIILLNVRRYCHYALSYRNLEEMMAERGIEIDHSTINRWVLKYAPELDKRIRPHLKPTNDSWRVDETYIKIKGVWKYLYRAVDSEVITVDKNAAYPVAIDELREDQTLKAETPLRQSKYLNNIVEQDHRNIKRIVKPMMGFKSFNSARSTLSGIEAMSLIRKGQVKGVEQGDSVSQAKFIESIFEIAV